MTKIHTSHILDPISITIKGVKNTIKGTSDLVHGNVTEGLSTIIGGLFTLRMAGLLLGLSEIKEAEMLLYGSGVGIAMGLAPKIGDLIQQIRKDLPILTGIVAILLATHSIGFLLEDPYLAVMGGLHAVGSGLHDLVKGRSRLGFYQLLLGIITVVRIGYYSYSAPMSVPCTMPQAPLSQEHVQFLESHKSEIEQIYESRITSGSWEKLGNGISKIAFGHPDLVGMIIKTPLFPSYRHTRAPDLQEHHKNLQQARCVASEFDRLVLPNCYLSSTSKGEMIVEEKLDLVESGAVPESPDKLKAIQQLAEFEEKTGLCDYVIAWAHNAGFIRDSHPPKIGIIDFDCKY